MLSIKNNVADEIMIEKSKFITKLFYLESFDDINTILKKTKEEYHDATHQCYAYIYESKKRCSDDGEPSGTAGMPILNVLESNTLDHILCIVIRYFGGIKLGAGGLVRAYTKSATKALEKTQRINLVEGYQIEITFPYNQTKEINYRTKNLQIINEHFQDQVTYEILIEREMWESIKEKISTYTTNIKIIKTLYLKK